MDKRIRLILLVMFALVCIFGFYAAFGGFK